MNRFSPAALGVRAHEFAEVDVMDRPRISGQSHYGLNRVFFVLRDLAALPFGLRGPMYWKRRFYFLKWFSLAVAVPLAANSRWIPSALAFFFGLIAYSNAWNPSVGLFEPKQSLNSASRTIGESMKSNVSVARLGAGYWGKKLLPKFVRSHDSLVRIICDVHPTHRAEINQAYPDIPTTPSFDEILSDPGVAAVILVTPPATHFSLARRAIEAGKHVWIEKPLALCVEEGQDLVGLSRSKGTVLLSITLSCTIRRYGKFAS